MSLTLLFDVDGTLTDTFDTAATIIEELSVQFHYTPPESRRKLRRIDWRELPAFLGVSRFKRRRFIKIFRERLRAAMCNATLSPDFDSILNIITTSGYRIGAMTSSSVTPFAGLSKNNTYFSMTDLGDFDVNKVRVLRDFLSRFNLKPSEVIYVGDEIEDILAAKQLGLTAVGAAWGLNHAIALQAVEPDFVINTPSELLTVLSQGNGE